MQTHASPLRSLILGALVIAFAAPILAKEPAGGPASSLDGLSAVYQELANAIIADKNTEAAVVRAILIHERDLAMVSLDAAAANPASAAAALREAAARIGDFATEGGSAVEPIRHRLLEAGHHHHADDTGPTATYDEGYVVVNKKIKVEVLDLSKRCAKLAEAPKVDAKDIAAIKDSLKEIAGRALAGK